MKFSKRISTLLLCAVMMFSLLPFSAMAEDFADAEQEDPTEMEDAEIEENNSGEIIPEQASSEDITDGEVSTSTEEGQEEEETAVTNSAAMAVTGDCGENGGNLTWSYDNGTLTISWTSGSKYMANYATSSAPWTDYSSAITKIVVGSNVKSVGRNAFSNCVNLVEVIFPDTLRSIGNSAFSNCTALETVKLPASLQSIGSEAFSGCTALNAINLPDSIVTIGYDAFSGCTSLTEVTVPKIDDSNGWSSAFEGSCLESVTLADGITEVAANAFTDCKNLKEINWPSDKSLTAIGTAAFQNTGFTSITVPEGVTSIGANAFYSCASLTSITLPDSVTTIDSSAFCNSGLVTVEFPGNVTLGSWLFVSDMAETSSVALESVKFRGDPPTFAADTFNGVNITAYYPAGNANWTSELMKNYGGTITWKMYIPEGVSEVASGTCGASTTWKLNANGELVVSGSGIMYNYDNYENPAPWMPYSDFIKTVTVEDGITSIGDYAFNGCNTLTAANLAGSVTKIGQNAFSQTGLTEITIPASSVDDRAFYQCTALQAVTTTSATLSIGSSAFRGCTALKTVNMTAGTISIGNKAFAECGIEQITLPEGVTKLNTGVFADCTQLTGIALPESLEYIGTNAFANTRLAKVTIPAGVTDIEDFAFTSGSMSYDDTGERTAEYENNVYLKEIRFEGKCLRYFGDYAFAGLTITAYYYGSDSSWDNTIYAQRDYGGEVTWKASYTLKDLLTLKRYLAGISNSGRIDVSGDGAVNLMDLLLLKQELAESGEI